MPPERNLGTAPSYRRAVAPIANAVLGTYPNDLVKRFPPGIVNGEMHQADAEALQARTDLTTAYNDAASRVMTERIDVELAGKTLDTRP